MNGYAPCGACASYVPVPAGCEHWKPGLTAHSQRERTRRSKLSAAVQEQRNANQRLRRAKMTEEERQAYRERESARKRDHRQQAKDRAAVDALADILIPGRMLQRHREG